jgi:hypothetical protein
MYSTSYVFAGPAELYVDKVKVGWTSGGLKMRMNRSMWFRPSMSGVGHDAAVKQAEEFYISTSMVEATFENLRTAWGLSEAITNTNAASDNKVMHFGGSPTVPTHHIKFRSIDRKLTVVFYKVVAADFGEIGHMRGSEILIPVTFKALLDTTKTIGAQIGYMTQGPSAYEVELTCRVSVKEIRKFLACKLTVRKKTTKALVSRYTTLKQSTKSLVMRESTKVRTTKLLVNRVTVA